MLLTETNIIFKGIRPLQKLGSAARGFAFNNPFAQMASSTRIPTCLKTVPPDPWPGDAQRGRDLIGGVFRFAGQTIEKDDLSWKPLDARSEWTAELHGFEWLRDLRSAGSDRARRMAREMVASWIEVCHKPEGVLWRPDVVGLRLTSWILFHDFFCSAAGDDFRKNYFTSLARQAKYLSRALPGELYGLPLMKALRGLAHVGLSFGEEGEDWLEHAFSLILREIRSQILPDGAHISRSPQQTFEFLQCLVDLRAALIAARVELPEEVQHAIDRIAPAVKFFRHADGGLSQFNGAQEGNAHLVETTIMHSGAKGRAMRALPHCGYERLQMGRSSLIMDVGLPLESRYSDRTHAGLLSFEYSYGRDRVLVNCGTSEVGGKWRDLLRQTAAHTALVVDNRNACGIDGSGLPSARPDVRVRRQEEENVALLETAHNGYVPRFGLTHRRVLRLKDLGDTVCGEDRLVGKSGVHFAVRFHLHPGIQVSLIKDNQEALLRARSGTGWRFSAQGMGITLEESVYCPEGESPRRTQQLVLNGITAGPETPIVWEMRREKI
jgi:uncharacterized heparinase superfamily protein